MYKILLLLILPLLTLSCIEVHNNKQGGGCPEIIRDTTIIERVVIVDTLRPQKEVKKPIISTPKIKENTNNNPNVPYGNYHEGYERRKAPNYNN